MAKKKMVPKRLQMSKKITYSKENNDGTITAWGPGGYVGKIAAPKKPKKVNESTPLPTINPQGEENTPTNIDVEEAFAKLQTGNEKPVSEINKPNFYYVKPVELFRGVEEFKNENPEFRDPTTLALNIIENQLRSMEPSSKRLSDEQFVSLVNKTTLRGTGQLYQELSEGEKKEAINRFVEEFFPTAGEDPAFIALISEPCISFFQRLNPGKIIPNIMLLKPASDWMENVTQYCQEMQDFRTGNSQKEPDHEKAMQDLREQAEPRRKMFEDAVKAHKDENPETHNLLDQYVKSPSTFGASQDKFVDFLEKTTLKGEKYDNLPHSKKKEVLDAFMVQFGPTAKRNPAFGAYMTVAWHKAYENIECLYSLEAETHIRPATQWLYGANGYRMSAQKSEALKKALSK